MSFKNNNILKEIIKAKLTLNKQLVLLIFNRILEPKFLINKFLN